MTVFGLVSGVAGFVKVRYLLDKAIIDNMIFRAHYRITSAILFAACILVTANNLIGDPINCISEGAVPTHVINTFCWITYTFSMPDSYAKAVGTHVPHPGVSNDIGEKRFHSYYQWVPFFLFFQGVLFYTPHWIWKQWEEGKVRMISDGIRGAIIESEPERRSKMQRLAQYLNDTMHLHNSYAAGYVFCEFLNLVNVIANIFIVDSFLGGAFLTYGTDVLSFSSIDQENRVDPMIRIFPRVTKCTFHKYGASGTIQKIDTLCILALNILNEKIYIFLWFWFILLAVMSAGAVVYTMAAVLLPNIRVSLLKRMFNTGTPSGINAIVRHAQIGDFMLIKFLSHNLNTFNFNELLDELSRMVRATHPSSPSAPSTFEMADIYPEIAKYMDTAI